MTRGILYQVSIISFGYTVPTKFLHYFVSYFSPFRFVVVGVSAAGCSWYLIILYLCIFIQVQFRYEMIVYTIV